MPNGGFIVDPVTGVAHKNSEHHLVDHTAELMGGTTAVVDYDMTEQALSSLLTNWMGDDGFLRKFDTNYWAIIPLGDSFFCKGQVLNKRIENGEHLVDIVVWAETIRGYISQSATATVSLFSRHEA